MSIRILICSDLDRTLLPNGRQEESAGARDLLHVLARRPEVSMAYVTGRHLRLLKDAVREFDLPVPDYAVGDVGATIYRISGEQWRPWKAWEDHISKDWKGTGRERIADLFEDMDDLTLQEPEKQNRFKLSYYAPVDVDAKALIREMEDRLQGRGLRSNLVWSVDEAENRGLLDLLPRSASKYQAIRFIMSGEKFGEEKTVFAGDSGNDLSVLTSGLQSILVKNARRDVREEALRMVKEKGLEDRLYVAQGGFLGMNGNYAAGVIEGLVHHMPDAVNWFHSPLQSSLSK